MAAPTVEEALPTMLREAADSTFVTILFAEVASLALEQFSPDFLRWILEAQIRERVGA